MFKIPLKTNNLVLSGRWPSCFVIHDIKETAGALTIFDNDSPAVQFNTLNVIHYRRTKETNLPYTFVVENVNGEFNVFSCNPLLSECNFPDLSPKFRRAIHIGIMGDLNQMIPPIRLYQIIAYRIITQYCRLFRISTDSIYTHSQISNDKSIQCPGEFFNVFKLRMISKSLLKRRAVTSSK